MYYFFMCYMWFMVSCLYKIIQWKQIWHRTLNKYLPGDSLNVFNISIWKVILLEHFIYQVYILKIRKSTLINWPPITEAEIRVYLNMCLYNFTSPESLKHVCKSNVCIHYIYIYIYKTKILFIQYATQLHL